MDGEIKNYESELQQHATKNTDVGEKLVGRRPDDAAPAVLEQDTSGAEPSVAVGQQMMEANHAAEIAYNTNRSDVKDQAATLLDQLNSVKNQAGAGNTVANPSATASDKQVGIDPGMYKEQGSQPQGGIDETRNTYDYNSAGTKDYDESVTTSTTQSSGKGTVSTTWDSEYKMGSDYTVDDSQDYSWNKLATEMAQLSYDQEAAQYRAQSIAAKQEMDAAATNAWNNYFAAAYSAEQTQDKMGWSGGQEKASDLQVMFLQAESAANMYTQDEMQRYGVETKLGIARMYAEANQKTLALEYYQDEVNKAISEANITGYYVPPEASEMFKQQELADKILNDPNATAEQKERAKNVNTNCEKYYQNLGFEKGTRKDENGKVVTEFFGIKTLSLLTHEETVRNNKINEEIQREANQIAQSQANATWKQVNIQEKQYNLDVRTQEQIEIKEMKESGQVAKSVSPTNYYETTKKVKDPKTGKMKTVTERHYVKDNVKNLQQHDGGAALYRYGGSYWVLDSNNNRYQVFNSSEEAANKGHDKWGLPTNYKP